MNYLAHLVLSGNEVGLNIGNFIGDFVKGDQLKNYESGIQQGIHLHRAIDTFTDHHPMVHASKQFFVQEYDKYSGVLVDVFYDYLLAKNIQRFSDFTLKEIAEQKYALLAKYSTVFPPNAKRFYEYMLKYNLLETYADLVIIERVLKGLTHRINERFILNNSIAAFKTNEAELEKHFLVFFPTIQMYVNEFKF